MGGGKAGRVTRGSGRKGDACRLLLFGAGPGGHNRGSDEDADEGQGNDEVMHGRCLLDG